MDRNILIIIGLIIVILALLIGIGVTTIQPPAKEEAILTIMNNDTIYEGDSIKFKLTDVNGTPLSSQSVNVTIADENGATDSYSVVTNTEGIGALAFNKTVGKYTVNCTFAGNDDFDRCNVTKKLTVEEKAAVAEVSSYSSSSAQPKTYASGLTDAEIEAYIQRDLEERAANGVNGPYDYEEARKFYENVPPTGME